MSSILGKQAKQKLLRGVQRVAEVVAPTLGPKGRFAVLEGPVFTNDGATIANKVTVEDPCEKFGAQIVQEVSKNVSNVVGDGTTTATILTERLFSGALKASETKHETDIRKELADSCVRAIKDIKDSARKATKKELEEISVRSCKDESLGKEIASLVSKVGEDAFIVVQQGKELSSEASEGALFGAKYLIETTAIPLPKGSISSHVLCLDRSFTDFQGLVPVIEELIENKEKHLVVFADLFDGDALRSVLATHQQGAFSVYVFKVANIHDASVVFGAKVFSPNEPFFPTVENLGFSEKMYLSKERVIAVAHEDITNLLKEIEGKERAAMLAGKVGFLNISGVSALELEDMRIRADDGIRACQATLKGGVVKGGGAMYTEVAKKCGSPIMASALKSIQQTIDKNAGKHIPTKDIVDPTLVLTTALIHATTAASQLIVTESVLL